MKVRTLILLLLPITLAGCGGAEPATQIYLARRLVYLLKFDVLRRVPQEP